jgi:transposase
VQRRLDEHPEKRRQRRETVEHPFGTIKARMEATHFLMKTLPLLILMKTLPLLMETLHQLALHVLAYNLKRVMNLIGCPTAHSGDEGIVVADTRPPAFSHRKSSQNQQGDRAP